MNHSVYLHMFAALLKLFFSKKSKNILVHQQQNTMTQAELKATLIGMIGPIFWGTTPALIILSGRVPGFQMTAMMFACASALSLFLWRIKKISPLKLLRQKNITPYLLLSLTGIFGINILYIFALRLAPPAEAFLLLNSWQVISMLLAAKQSKKPLQKNEKAALFLCLTGISILAKIQSENLGHSFTIGHVCAILAAFCWAFYSNKSSRYISVQSESLGLVFIISSALSTLLHFIFENEIIIPPPNSLAYIIILGLLPSGSAYIAWKHAIRHGNIRALSLLSYIGPLSAIFWLSLLDVIELNLGFIMAFICIIGGALVGSSSTITNTLFSRKSSLPTTLSPPS